MWTLELMSSSHEAVAFDAWIEKEAGIGLSEEDPRQSKFDGQSLRPGQRATTLTVPATARRAIAVGAVGNLNVGLPRPYQAGGTGPTRDGRLKPELVAPGVDICSKRPLRSAGRYRDALRSKGRDQHGRAARCGRCSFDVSIEPGTDLGPGQADLDFLSHARGGRRDFDRSGGLVWSMRMSLRLVRQTAS